MNVHIQYKHFNRVHKLKHKWSTCSIWIVFCTERGARAATMASSMCQTCGKPVYIAEEIRLDGKSYHKACFACQVRARAAAAALN